TAGLTQSGRYVLKADCAQAGKVTINGSEGYWLRGRLTQALPPDSGQVLPEADTIRLSTTVNRALRGRIRVAEPHVPAPEAVVDPTGATIPAFTSPGAAALGGKVTNEAGHPVTGAVVQLIDPGDPTRPAFVSLATEKDGLYSIPNVPFSTG